MNSSSRHAAAAVGAQLAQVPSAALGGGRVERAAPAPTRDGVEQEAVPERAQLICWARSLSAANAIAPGAKPTPAQIALMSWRWL